MAICDGGGAMAVTRGMAAETRDTAAGKLTHFLKYRLLSTGTGYRTFKKKTQP
jgi:hypothetical protein